MVQVNISHQVPDITKVAKWKEEVVLGLIFGLSLDILVGVNTVVKVVLWAESSGLPRSITGLNEFVLQEPTYFYIIGMFALFLLGSGMVAYTIDSLAGKIFASRSALRLPSLSTIGWTVVVSSVFTSFILMLEYYSTDYYQLLITNTWLQVQFLFICFVLAGVILLLNHRSITPSVVAAWTVPASWYISAYITPILPPIIIGILVLFLIDWRTNLIDLGTDVLSLNKYASIIEQRIVPGIRLKRAFGVLTLTQAWLYVDIYVPVAGAQWFTTSFTFNVLHYGIRPHWWRQSHIIMGIVTTMGMYVIVYLILKFCFLQPDFDPLRDANSRYSYDQ